ncbi:MAG: hypothetical protein ACT4OU_09970 [Hyphomicrobium sp.]
MRFISRIAALSISFAGAGCSHIPTPEQIPDVEPYAILQHIRCETRQAIETDFPTNKHLKASSIGYGLTLTADENAAQTAGLGLHWPIVYGTIDLGASAAKEKQRTHDSITNVVEAVTNTLSAPCDHEAGATDSWKYPIVGAVGMREIVRQFVAVNSIGQTTADGGFVRTLTFRLKFSGGLSPSFAFVTAVNPLVDGGLGFAAVREDKHILVVAMTPPQTESTEKIVKVQIENINDLRSGAQMQDFDRSYEKTGPSADKGQRQGDRARSVLPQQSPALRSLSNTLRNRQEQRQFQDFITDELR